jgi:SAM-dependent methyltransferase
MQKTKEKPWHEQDSFWETFGPVIFNSKVIQAASQEVEHLTNLLNLRQDSIICDMCCGVGRHSLELARRGFKVTGVDRTRSYLRGAKKKADAEGLDIQFVNEDIRDFCRLDSFDVVLNLYTSFGYFEKRDDERVALKNIYKSIKSGGKFVIELMGKEVLARIFQERDWREEDGIILLEERKIGENWDFIESRWILIKDGERFECKFYPRIYSAVELCELLGSCGFDRVDTYGGLDGSPYDQKASRLVVVGCK